MTEGQFIDAAAAEKRGRETANARLKAVGEIIAGQVTPDR